MVAGHGKLGQFLLEPETGQGIRDGKLIAETETVVVEAKTDLHDGCPRLGGVIHALHGADGLLQGDEHLIVVVADLRFFAPDGFPSLVESAVFRVFQYESMGKVIAPFEGEAHLGGQHDRLPCAVEGILRNAVDDFEFQFQLAVGAFYRDGVGIGVCEKSKSQAKEDKGEFFHDDNLMMMGAKIGKIWKWGGLIVESAELGWVGICPCPMTLFGFVESFCVIFCLN